MGVSNKKIVFSVAAATTVLVGLVIFAYVSLFGAPVRQAELKQFTVAIGQDDSSEVAPELASQGFIKNQMGFRIALMGIKGMFSTCVDCIMPGAYKISKAMNVWDVARTLKQGPYMKWAVIPEGLRKEEIAEILKATLGWSDEVKGKWVSTYTAMAADHIEGVYFPDTYLIPLAESPLDVANRLRSKFEEKFAPYAKEAIKQNIKWTTVLKLASIVQREAANKDDMPLIASILWNRLNTGMRLEVDATLQYARGNTGSGWWAPISAADKQSDSPYNSYKYKSLPPHPISNPGLDAIAAALNLAKTECLFYLHDKSSTTHCAVTFDEHKANIKKYLR